MRPARRRCSLFRHPSRLALVQSCSHLRSIVLDSLDDALVQTLVTTATCRAVAVESATFAQLQSLALLPGLEVLAVGWVTDGDDLPHANDAAYHLYVILRSRR